MEKLQKICDVVNDSNIFKKNIFFASFNLNKNDLIKFYNLKCSEDKISFNNEEDEILKEFINEEKPIIESKSDNIIFQEFINNFNTFINSNSDKIWKLLKLKNDNIFLSNITKNFWPNFINSIYNNLKNINILFENIHNLNNFENCNKKIHFEFPNCENLLKNMKYVETNFYNINNVNSIDSTKILCWWCCSICGSNTIFLPDKIENTWIENNVNMPKFYVFGFFCSFNCAYSYNLNMNDNKIFERISYLYLYKKIYYNDDNIINPSPPKELLSYFGGNMNYDDFKKKNLYPEKVFYNLNSNFIYKIPLYIDEMKKINNNDLILKRTKNKCWNLINI